MQITENQSNIGAGKSIARPAGRQSSYHYHAKVWTLWLLAALTPAMLTQNPLYLLIIILAVGLNYHNLDHRSPVAQGWGAFLRLGLILIAVSIVFNLVFVNAGATHLFTLPELRWEITTQAGPITILQIGGDVSLESLLYGLSTGLALLALLLTFATFNAQVDHYQLLRSMPRFLYQSAIVMSIAITFIPQMFIAQREIREAQALRGHRFRTIRDLLPLFVTLLAEGLERSLTLAESMEARGFSHQPAGAGKHRGLLLKSTIAVALLVLISGALAWNYFPNQLIGGLAMVAGVLMLITAIWSVGRNVPRSRYRRTVWRYPDTYVTIAAVIVMLVFLTTWLTQRSALIFYPYPRVAWPPFNPILALTLLLISAPALVSRLTWEKSYD